MGNNIAETFVTIAKEYSERIAVIEARSGKQLSFKELNSRSDAYAKYFASEGLKPGDTVILMVTPSVDFICLTLALFKVGTPIVLIDPGMGYKNILRCIERVEAKVLVGIPKAIIFSKLFPKVFKTLAKTFCCGKSLGLLGPDISNIRLETEMPYPVYQASGSDLAAIIFTTGSTGPPKGVKYEHSVFSAQLRLIKEYYDIGPNDVDQPAFPLFALFSAALGACSVIPDMDPTKPAKVDPVRFVSSIDRYKVTYSFGSPAIWNVVSSYCLEKDIVLSSLKKVLMAGAPVPYDLMQRVIKTVHQDAKVFTPYGATESLPIVSIEGKEIVSDTWERSRKGKGTCVGRPLPGVEIKIINISDTVLHGFNEAVELGVGEIGEIIVRGEVVTKSYLNDPYETRMAKIDDGETFWHRMGDVGYLDSKQRLWFCGRRGHRVTTAKGTLFSIPCEAITNEHPAVYRSALVGITGGEGDSMQIPVMIVEFYGGRNICKEKTLGEVEQLAKQNSLTVNIGHFLYHNSFPVDIRHNAKIFREKLAVWAQKKIYP